MNYRVKLPVFEGPLDLLLFLIRKEEVDIYDIPIAQITREYLDYIEIMRELDLDIASEFILMAATLMRIKVQMMLPRPPVEDEKLEDPREGLVKSLLEYQRYKEASERLSEFEQQARQHFYRQIFDKEGLSEEDLANIVEVSLFDLMEALKRVLDSMPKKGYHDIQREPVSVEEQMKYILTMLIKRGKVVFTELLGEIRERIVIVITFLALLELVKEKAILLYQLHPFQEIWISTPGAVSSEQ